VAALSLARPLALALGGAALSGVAPTPPALALTLLVALASTARLLHGSRQVAALAAREFNFYFVLASATIAGASGCAILQSSLAQAALWALTQLLLSSVLLSDGAPQVAGWVGRAERLSAFPALALFWLLSIWLLHTARFPGQDKVIAVLGVARSVRQICLSAVLSLAGLSIRFAYRALRTRDALVVCDRVRRLAVTDEEARLLSASARSSIAASARRLKALRAGETWVAPGTVAGT
jgi:hypothetical protein